MESTAGRKRNLYRLLVAINDIHAAQQAARLGHELVANSGEEMLWPLMDAVAVAYGRPFSDNRPYGPLGRKWTRFDSAELQTLHDNLVELRNKLVAHSDGAVRPVVIFPPGATEAIGNSPGTIIWSVGRETPKHHDFAGAEALTADLLGRMRPVAYQEVKALFADDPRTTGVNLLDDAAS